MEFFDYFGKRISQAAQSTAQKANEMTEIVRLNNAISEEERKINNNYYQIGKLYVAIHTFDFEKDFSGMISVIKESEQNILDFKKKIQDIKGIVRCENCGAEIVKGAVFCSFCGKPIPKTTLLENSAEFIRCSGCGAMIDKNMRFCTACGKPTGLISNATSDMEADLNNTSFQDYQEQGYSNCEKLPDDTKNDSFCDAPITETVSQANEKEFMKCSNCGAMIERGVLFCTECGVKVQNLHKVNFLKCQNCGAEISEEDVFCTNCGEKL